MALPVRVSRSLLEGLDNADREFDVLFRRMFNRGDGLASSSFPVDVREDADHFYVEADLPGFGREEVDVTLDNSTLTIVAERKQQQTQEQGEWLLNERRSQKFQRSFTLPPTVDGQKVDARLADGVLHITLNKREESKPRKISVG